MFPHETHAPTGVILRIFCCQSSETRNTVFENINCARKTSETHVSRRAATSDYGKCIQEPGCDKNLSRNSLNASSCSQFGQIQGNFWTFGSPVPTFRASRSIRCDEPERSVSLPRERVVAHGNTCLEHLRSTTSEYRRQLPVTLWVTAVDWKASLQVSGKKSYGALHCLSLSTGTS